MYPQEMSFDKQGIGYIDISNNTFPLIPKKFDNLDYKTSLPRPLANDFYLLPSTMIIY